MSYTGIYRGKRKDTGERVEGYLIKGNRTYIVTADAVNYMVVSASCLACVQLVEVDPETVDEFTGLFVLGTQKIFERDIVRFNEANYVVQRECDTPGGYWAETGFILKRIGWSDYLSFTDTIDEYHNEICVQIIGNTSDNPELLEGG